MIWAIVLIFIVVLVVISKLVHFNAMRHKILIIAIVFFIFIFVITFLNVVNSSSVNLKTASGLFQAGKVYFSWMGHLFGNVKVLTGNAVRMDWFGNMSAKI
ncbi:MAG: hypothetical protein Q8L27_03775 [archaeon]|nr:hypothetical protein [archaeon]